MASCCIQDESPSDITLAVDDEPWSAPASPEPTGEQLSVLPALVLEIIWSHLCYASRRHLRASCRALRQRLDSDLIHVAAASDHGTAGAVLRHLLLLPLHRPGPVVAARPSQDERRFELPAGLPTPETPPSSVLNGNSGRHRASSFLSPHAAAAAAPGPASPNPEARFHSLRALVLTPHAASSSAAARDTSRHNAHRASLPASLQPFFFPAPSSLLAPFTASRCLTHLILLDFLPGPTERDVATIASAFPALTLLHILVSPGCSARTAVPPLGALRACERLRSLALDLGRGSVMGSGARSSLGVLTQLTDLVLGLADTGGNDLEAVCCGTGGLAYSYNYHHHHHHHYSMPHSFATRSDPTGSAANHRAGPGQAADTNASRSCSRGCGAGAWHPADVAAPAGMLPLGMASAGGGVVVAAMVGGIEASLYTLARANLRSLELRVISFGVYERRLLQAVAAGSAEAAARGVSIPFCPAVTPADSDGNAVPCSCAGPLPAHCGTSLQATVASSAASRGLRRLSIRLMPSPHHAAASSASFAAGGSGGLGGAFGGGGLGGELLATPSASLSCGPLALGNALPGTVGWAQPSETEALLAALPTIPSLEVAELPELLLTSSHQLACLSALTRLRELRLGGVVAAGVPAPKPSHAGGSVGGAGVSGVARRKVVVHGMRSLTVEAENPASYGRSGVPWWTVMCPSLSWLSLTMQLGGSTGGALGTLRHDGAGGGAASGMEQLAAALACVPETRLVVCAAARAAGVAGQGTATASAFGSSAAGGAVATALRHDLPMLLRSAPGVRHLELYLDDPAELLTCLSPDLLARNAVPAPVPPDASETVSVQGTAGTAASEYGRAAGAAGGVCGACFGKAQCCCRSGPSGVQSLKLATVAGLDALGAAAAAAAAASLCNTLVAVLKRAEAPLGFLCLSVPGLLSSVAAPCCVDGGCAPWAEAVRELARAAAARGTQLCLCGLGSDQRARLLFCLARWGVEVAEGRCQACCREPPVHANL